MLWWGEGIRGIADASYPHPMGWTFSELRDGVTLDRMTVKQLTAAFRLEYEGQPNCIEYWAKAGLPLPLDRVGHRYSSGLLTPKDYSSHFKNITHHRILLRSVRPHNGSALCRCCRRHTENTMHLASCKKIREVWLTFNRLVAASHRQTPLTHALIFHAQEPNGSLLPQGLSALHLITWKILIYHFTMVDTENRRFNHEHYTFGIRR